MKKLPFRLHYNVNVERNIRATEEIINLLLNICNKNNYVCVNSNLSKVDIKASISEQFKHNLMEFKIIRKDLTAKYVPNYLVSEFNNDNVFGFNMLGLGGNELHPILSSTSNIRYREIENTLTANPLDKISFIDFIYFLDILSKNNVMIPTKV